MSAPRDGIAQQGGRLKGVVQAALEEARRLGASSAEASANLSQGLALTVRLGEVETVEHTRDQGLAVTVFFGQRTGSASTSDLRPEAVRESVRAAASIARFTAEDPYAGLPDLAALAREIPDLDLYHPWRPGTDEAIARAVRCEDTARAVDPRISNSEGASLSAYEAVEAYGNSLGFLADTPYTRQSLSCAVIAEDASGNMQRDYWYSTARAVEDLEPETVIGRRAAERTLRRLNGRKLDTRKAAVLFEAPVATSLLGHFIGAIRGASLYRGASFLLNQLGQPVFAPHVRIHEQPFLKRGLGSTPFDSEGVAPRNRDIVKDGVLQGYVLDTYSARKLGMQTTGNSGGVHNLTLESGAQDFDALLRTLGTGLLVTELIGFGVNTVTGDYSRGAAGFWVENGVIAYPVEEITIAGRLQDMFRHIVAVGRDIDTRGNIRCGSILIENMTIAGS